MKKVAGVLLAAVAVGAIAFVGCPGGGSSSPPPPGAPAAPPPPGTPAPPPPPPGPSGAAPGGGFGTIKGHAIQANPGPTPALVPDKDQNVCGTSYTPDAIVVGAGGALANAVIFIKGPNAPGDWDKRGPYVIDQKACHYSPRVTIVPVGATVTFKSSDPVQHNVSATNLNYNEMVNIDSPRTKTCDQTMFCPLQCNIHKFMAGWLVVLDNPWYGLTEKDGSCTITKVPAGTWRVFAKHEVLGKGSGPDTVTVPANGEVTVEFKFD